MGTPVLKSAAAHLGAPHPVVARAPVLVDTHDGARVATAGGHTAI